MIPRFEHEKRRIQNGRDDKFAHVRAADLSLVATDLKIMSQRKEDAMGSSSVPNKYRRRMLARCRGCGMCCGRKSGHGVILSDKFVVRGAKKEVGAEMPRKRVVTRHVKYSDVVVYG